MRPFIGITCDYNSEGPTFWLKEGYAAAVQAAGGIPVLLPPLETKAKRLTEIIRRVSGLVITGGDFDIEPSYYGEEPAEGLRKLNPRRSAFELALCRLAFEEKVPILGICGGMQAINVALGGTLHQDIAMELPGGGINHEQGCAIDAHAVSIVPASLLGGLLQRAEIKTNSNHHQAVKDPAPGLTVCARSRDGLVEAIESDSHGRLLGVQWHPESLYLKDPIWIRVFAYLLSPPPLETRGRSGGEAACRAGR